MSRVRWSLVVALAVVAVRGAVGAQTPTPLMLMPMPASMRPVAGRVPIGPSMTVALKTVVVDMRLRAAVDRMRRRLEGRTGYTVTRAFATDAASATLVIECQSTGGALPSLGDDEAYTLETNGAQVWLRAPSVYGAMHGLETLLQLLSGDRDGFYIPGVRIDDRPRFRWRGLLIDVGRHFEPVDVIKRELDAMAAVKLNVLHWHLSEDQGFRVETRKLPKLHTLGSDGLYYTQDQLREVVEYARVRGIRVVPEFDMPGHATSWLVGYPELASAPGPYTVERRFGIFDPTFDPTKEETYRFLDTFIGEMAPLFPDAYWHIGGDENNGKQWAANPAIQSFMKAKGLDSAHALQTYFNQRLLPILKKNGKRMMGWDEILQPGLPKEAVIQSWRGPQALVDAAKQGYDGILSAGYYIDLMNTAASHYAADPLPAGNGLSEADAAHILGGEATMWGEWVSPETIDSRIWPRTAAIAERLWSPREINDVADMYRRLAVISRELEEHGLTHERNVDVLLRRLSGGRDLTSLKVLAGVLEPVKGYQRGEYQPEMTTAGPLTHLVDAVTADSATAREVSSLIAGLLDDAPRFARGRDALVAQFRAWRDVKPSLDALVDQAPALKEAAPLVQDLEAMGTVGLEALGFLSTRGVPVAEWRTAALAALDRAARPKAALEFPCVRAVRELAIAAAEQGQLSSTSVADWRQRIRTLASPPKPAGAQP